MIDLKDPMLNERLRKRTAEGRYEISESELISTIRALHAAHNEAGVQRLCEELLRRCGPFFQRYSDGLRHRSDLREEAIANMSEKLLREVLDPDEVFMGLNFVHYIRCLCMDEFNRILRQEGLIYKRDAEGRPTGRPQHVPRGLMEHLQVARDDEEGQMSGADVADPHDPYEELHADEESTRILTYLKDPLDRKIVVLRVLEGMKWDDIAELCARTERTVRLRFDKARSYLRDCVLHEQQSNYNPAVYHQ